MSGTTGDIIVIIIIPVVILAFMLGMIFYANSHPQWRTQAPPETVFMHPLERSVPAQRLSSPGLVVPGQRPGADVDEVTPGQVRGE